MAAICLELIKSLMTTALLSVGCVMFAMSHSEIPIKSIEALLGVGHAREGIN